MNDTNLSVVNLYFAAVMEPMVVIARRFDLFLVLECRV